MIILQKKHEHKNHYKQIKEQDFLEKNIRNGSILSISQWREAKHIVQEQKIDVAVEFSSNACSLSDKDEISKAAMVQINFETFKDGRPFTFAKMLRKKYNLLMNGNKPLGDKWNFDKENQKSTNSFMEIGKGSREGRR